jgi:hypothetical protein
MTEESDSKRKTHVNFRLSDSALLVLQLHQEDLVRVKQRAVDRTEALEDILLTFRPQTSVLAQIKRAVCRKPATDPYTKPLEAFLSA